MTREDGERRARPIMADGRVVDVAVSREGKTRHMWGRAGPDKELALAEGADPKGLPVVLGAGLGLAAAKLAQTRQVAVVDKDPDIAEASGAREALGKLPNVRLVTSPDPRAALLELTHWQVEQGGAPFTPVAVPFYLSLDPDHYRSLHESLLASAKADFWGKVSYPKFQNTVPRLLLLSSQYFLLGELTSALTRMDIPFRVLDVGGKVASAKEFLGSVLAEVLDFKPDFALTVNHLGVDKEGALVTLLEEIGLPLASWFVDNPHLILFLYRKWASPLTALFTWDADNLGGLGDLGLKNVFHLPLGADPNRFAPDRPLLDPALAADVSFVGNSMVIKTAKRFEASGADGPLAENLADLALEFGQSSERTVEGFLAHSHPELLHAYNALGDVERKLAYATALTWRSTLEYRKGCVARTLPFSPLIVGDPGWKELFANQTGWRHHKELNYYLDLPGFYPGCAVNFNATSLQMKGAVNQRVFDVPAAGAFVLTDYRAQIEDLFEPGREVAIYRDPEEIPGLIEKYLADKPARQAIAQAGRKRVLAQHTYDHRIQTLITHMRACF